MRSEWTYLAGNEFGPQRRNMPVQNPINAERQNHFARRVQNAQAKWHDRFGHVAPRAFTAKSFAQTLVGAIS
jgi:hypothetical protein